MLDEGEFEPDERTRAELVRERFLSSHRAIAVCAREFSRLAQELIERATVVCEELRIEQEPELRQTPDRCIVQMGPQALTLAWLRGPLDSLADGRLLVIAWEGTIARRRFTERPERLNAPRAVETAVVIWEETFVASADDETTWVWQSETDPSRRLGSPELAARMIDKARAVWQLKASA
jgi:hypothetical protein